MRRELFAKSLLLALAIGSGWSCSKDSVGPGPNEVAQVSIFSLVKTVAVGSTLQLEGRAVNYSGVRIENQVTLNWTTSNAGIATVSSNGLVTGVAVGGATITVSHSSGFFHSVVVNVTGTVGGGT